MNYKQIAEKYISAGLSILPTKENKSPMIGEWRGINISADKFLDVYGIGIKCGQESGGIECIDFDNNFGDAVKILGKYLAIQEVKEIYQKYKLPIEITINKGYHLIFRCFKNDGNRKLASRLNENKIPEAIIETRGEGGYFCADPTPGYEIVRNNILDIKTISELERAILIDNAISFNEYYQIYKTQYESNDRPGDLYNSKQESVYEMMSILKSSGWVEISNGKWRRPGKKDGISATIGYGSLNIFYVFTSNGFPFECMKAYTPFQVLALIKYKGDFSAAAMSLPKGEKIIKEKNCFNESEIEKVLKNSIIDIHKDIEKPPTILSVVEDRATSTIYRRIFSLGNFSCVIGKAKSKKTYLMVLFTSVIIGGKDIHERLLGEIPANKKLVVYIDTEQGDYDSYITMKRINDLTDISGISDNFKGINLRQYSPLQRCEIIEYIFKLWGNDIALCVIDGIADLANAINDEAEATRVVSMLLRLTKDYNCHISTIIHQNKQDNYATGHLGSSVMKKAEIIISVNKVPEDIYCSEINCDYSRGVMFKPFLIYINSDGLPEIEQKINNKINKTNILNPYDKDDNVPF